MSKAGSVWLDTGDRLPEFELKLVSGATMRIPQDLRAGYRIIFFYRGYW